MRKAGRHLLAVLAWLSVAGAAGGAELRAKLTSLATRPRTDAPMLAKLELESTGSRPVEGVVEIAVRSGGIALAVVRTPELVVAGKLEQQIVLPALGNVYGDERIARLALIQGDSRADLGEFELGSRDWSNKNLVVASGRSGAQISERTPPWVGLKLERTNPGPTYTTSPWFLEPEEFFTDPLRYCAFDILVLDAPVFAQLREKQVAALGDWLGAGGSLLVAVPSALPEAHARVLREWAERDPMRIGAVLADDGTVPEGAEKIRRYYSGLGRLVLAAETPATLEEWKTAEWQKVSAFLWKMDGQSLDKFYKPEQRSSYGAARALPEVVLAASVPESVRTVPIGVLVGILAAFIVAVGPLDRWVLGRVSKRRYTWVTFPVTAIAFTVLMTWTARHYLGGSDAGRAIVVTDIAPDGKAVRETRIDVRIAARAGLWESEYQHALFRPYVNTAQWGGRGDGAVSSAEYTGQYPSRYRVRRAVKQWEPVANVSVRVAGLEDRSGVKWDAYSRPDAWNHLKVLERMNPVDGRRVFAGLFAGNTDLRWQVSGGHHQTVRTLVAPYDGGHGAILVPEVSPEWHLAFPPKAWVEIGSPDRKLSQGTLLFAWRESEDKKLLEVWRKLTFQ